MIPMSTEIGHIGPFMARLDIGVSVALAISTQIVHQNPSKTRSVIFFKELRLLSALDSVSDEAELHM